MITAPKRDMRVISPLKKTALMLRQAQHERGKACAARLSAHPEPVEGRAESLFQQTARLNASDSRNAVPSGRPSRRGLQRRPLLRTSGNYTEMQTKAAHAEEAPPEQPLFCGVSKDFQAPSRSMRTWHGATYLTGIGARLTAACIAMLLFAACSSHRHIAGTTEDLGDLRVAIDATAGLRRCRYVAGSQHITIDLGERANKQIERALDEVFTLDDDGEAAPNMIAIPRIASVNAMQQNEFGRIDTTITYAVWFQTPAGEPITEVTGTGSGSSDYPGLINLARLLFHLGTFFLFEGIDVGRQYRSAMHEAQADAQDALVGALQRSPELRQYVATTRSPQRVQSRDAALESLLDSVIAGRAMAIAVLDLQPIAGQPAAVESYLAEEIRTRLAQRRGVQTFERALLAHALEELQLGMSDLADPEHVRRFGRLVAADAILTGTTMHFPHDVKLMLRVLDTETGEVIGAGSTMLRLGSGLPGGGSTRTDPGPACP
jgi:hypothetical protein